MNDVTQSDKVLDWLAEHWAVFGYGPTLREIQSHFGWKSHGGAVYHLRRLRAAGRVNWDAGQPRSIKPTTGNA